MPPTKISVLVANIWPFFLRILLSPAGKTFVISLISWLLVFQYCHLRYWREPHSAFFHSKHAYEFKYSQYREVQANAFIERAQAPSAPLKKASANPEICGAFTTVKREKKQYIDAAVGSMLEGLTDEERSKLFVYVMFANVDPAVHPTFNQPWLNNTVDVAGGYNVSEEVMAHLRDLEDRRDFREKGVFDYLYALDYCYQTHAPYIAMFEGDIIFADGWMAKTLKALREIKKEASAEAAPFFNWIYLRLFYSETYIHWGPEDFLWRNRGLIFVSAIVSGYAVLILIRSFLPKTRRHLDNWTLAVLCLITIPAFLAFLYMVGRNTLFPLNTVFRMNKNGCCSQALVFPRSQVLELMPYLRKIGSGQTDMMIEDYATERGMQRLAIRPQVVQHVGLQSSRDNGATNTQSVWAFWFEELGAKTGA